ncbi:MAG TPA: indolepyruvate ferredoxin oxidoreductase subunit alpha [Rhodobacteraceae bacterium]|nr:indolepyruvate ferredoxin oxidoreductase subunit alpha [Paracoccaceae bacterium]
MVRPLMGNEALARGAWEAGVRVASAYPGTPSTEILENLARFPESDLVAQWGTNEKVAFDVAAGASFAGVRALAVMKHVGLNVAADALMSQTYIGVNGGLVIIVCDDPGIHSSQNEQDTRLYAQLAQIPVLEPSDAQEALEFTRIAFDISETFDTPVIVRSTTRLSHTRSVVVTGERHEVPVRPFIENPAKNVMIPLHARQRHPQLFEREKRLGEYFDHSDLTRVERHSPDFGVITQSVAYSYVKEVLPEASVLKLAASHPLPEATIREFCASVKRVFVVEELEPVVENALHAMKLEAEGKKWFPRDGEFSPEIVRAGFEKAGILAPLDTEMPIETAPVARPPVLCSGCPHTSAYMAVRGLEARVAGDIGCYTLAAVKPLQAIDTCVSMGSSIANAVGMAKAGLDDRPIIATLGDSTFLHSGIPPLIDAVYNDANITVIILDNHITAMTGGQDHAATGKTLRGTEAHRIDFAEMCKAVGVKWIRTVDSYDVGAMLRTFREATEFKGVSVVISDRPCVLDPVKIMGPAMQVDRSSCIACQSCMNLGCPSLLWSDEWHDGHHKITIEETTCIGCSLCAQVCPSDCIKPVTSA